MVDNESEAQRGPNLGASAGKFDLKYNMQCLLLQP
jgi:hypothetical protein